MLALVMSIVLPAPGPLQQRRPLRGMLRLLQGGLAGHLYTLTHQQIQTRAVIGYSQSLTVQCMEKAPSVCV